jgi:hypothetical protein
MQSRAGGKPLGTALRGNNPGDRPITSIKASAYGQQNKA